MWPMSHEASHPEDAAVEQSLGEEAESVMGDGRAVIADESLSHLCCIHCLGHAFHHYRVRCSIRSVLQLSLCLSALAIVPLHGGHSHEAHFYSLN